MPNTRGQAEIDDPPGERKQTEDRVGERARGGGCLDVPKQAPQDNTVILHKNIR